MSTCEHRAFFVKVNVQRLVDETSGGPLRFALEATVHCTDCRTPFQFMGLPAGSNLEGPAVSIDGLEARLAICPQGEQPSALDTIAAALGRRLDS